MTDVPVLASLHDFPAARHLVLHKLVTIGVERFAQFHHQGNRARKPVVRVGPLTDDQAEALDKRIRMSAQIGSA